MDKRIEVGVLGRDGHGRPAVHQPARGASRGSRSTLARGERALGGQALRGRRALAARDADPGRDRASARVEPAPRAVGPKLVFSALDASVAGEIEQAFADAGHFVVSNARNHRMDPTCRCSSPRSTPITSGCSACRRRRAAARARSSPTRTARPSVLTMALAPLRPFGLRVVPRHHDAGGLGRGLPWCPLARHPRQRDPVHRRRGGEDRDRDAQDPRHRSRAGRSSCTRRGQRAHEPRARDRRPHRDGVGGARAEAVARGRCAPPSTASRGAPQRLGLPTAPPPPVLYLDQPNRPQPRFDAGRGRGMTVSVGRLRPCPVLDWKFVTLGHNTVRGAAGAARAQRRADGRRGLAGLRRTHHHDRDEVRRHVGEGRGRRCAGWSRSSRARSGGRSRRGRLGAVEGHRRADRDLAPGGEGRRRGGGRGGARRCTGGTEDMAVARRAAAAARGAARRARRAVRASSRRSCTRWP